MLRAQDVILGAHGVEVEMRGNVRDLVFGADLSSIEQIWDTVEERVDAVEKRRERARELRQEIVKRKKLSRR